ncbi:hypothetical protein [Azospirillum aestuarii]|uniref:hypothetical protein n=1 Tax=Azospirillum aestuarii TaxID=2802052 RepID=UPI001909CD6B|nr:hypothetical protein [Azospirillum brasilense]
MIDFFVGAAERVRSKLHPALAVFTALALSACAEPPRMATATLIHPRAPWFLVADEPTLIVLRLKTMITACRKDFLDQGPMEVQELPDGARHLVIDSTIPLRIGYLMIRNTPRGSEVSVEGQRLLADFAQLRRWAEGDKEC